jgi:DNA-directed RNA polymerase specialized sigma subunit
VGPEDLIQEVITLAYEGDSTALGGNPTWVYSLVSKQQDFLCLEEDVASREIPMSDLLADIHMILTKDEQAAMELSLEQDLSRTQIAELLLTSDREVRRLLRSARMKIKAYLHGYRHV